MKSMNLTTPKNILTNLEKTPGLARAVISSYDRMKSKPVPKAVEVPVTFAQLAKRLDVPETSLRRRLGKLGIYGTPFAGCVVFSQSQADVLENWNTFQHCAGMWAIVADRACKPVDADHAIKQCYRLIAKAERTIAQLMP